MGQRLLLLVILMLGPMGSAAAATHDATPGLDAACAVVPRSAEELLDLLYEPAGTPSDRLLSSFRVTEERDLPSGDPADTSTVAALDSVAQEWVSCINTGDLLRASAMVTDDMLQYQGLGVISPGYQDFDLRVFDPTPVTSEFRSSVGPAHNAQILPDGRVGAAFVLEWRETQRNVFILFRQQDGQWRLDDMVFVPVMNPVAPVWGYRIVEEFPHDPNAYTQGLIIHDGSLYEGTGLRGESTLRLVDLPSGEVLRSRELAEEHFGEGVAILNDRIYQLTWQTQTCFFYDLETFEQLDTFTYETEGWGLTTDGERLIMSDGTSRIVFRDPETFRETDHIDVLDSGMPVSNLNELEYIDGEIWANVYQTDRVVRIDPSSGDVTGWIDFTGLLSEEERESYAVDVLNGIAYEPESERIFVTGKLWPKLFEVELVPPQ